MLYRAWDSFAQACNALCDTADRPTRTCIRWRHAVGLLVIKVTDDKQTLTFKTRSSVYLNRFDALNRQLLRKYANKRRAGPITTSTGAGAPDAEGGLAAAGAVRGEGGEAGAEGTAAAATSGAGAGPGEEGASTGATAGAAAGGKKKKAKGKKKGAK
ncbi:hypothetical protein JCM8202_006223 [Rhodotorula sphaerocarpa]